MSAAVAVEARSDAHAATLCVDEWLTRLAGGRVGRLEVTVTDAATGSPMGGVRFGATTEAYDSVFPFAGFVGPRGGLVRADDREGLRRAALVMLRRARKLGGAS